jgi:hypothetical protein
MPTLNWIGKQAVVNHHQQVPFHLLKDVPDLSCGDPGSLFLVIRGPQELGKIDDLVRKSVSEQFGLR